MNNEAGSLQVEMFVKKEYRLRHHFLQGVLDYTHTPLVAANVQHTASRSSLRRIS